jgi:DNA-binding NtrC family response regulator
MNHVPSLSSLDVAAAPEMPSKARSSALWLAGSSVAITQLRGQIRRVAPYFRTAVLVGEPGCGEEAAAQLLHQQSPRCGRPFLHLKSAEALSLFAGTRSEDALAAVGMFYISRPDQLPPIAQAALLSLTRRYGPQAPRVVAFAQRGLRPLVSANGFSAELADLLGSLRIAMPRLRDRREDIPQLLSSLLQRIAALAEVPLPQLAPDLMDAARSLSWNGNLPQLHAAAKGLLERANQHTLHSPDLDAVLGSISQPTPPQLRETRMIRLEEIIQEHIRSVLFACHGNKLRTAEVLGISRSTLYRMLDIPAHPCAPPHSHALDPSNLQMAG